MASYDAFARFYDAVNGDGSDQALRVARWIDQYRDRPVQTLLELGCGTGSVLAGLSHVPSLTGLDNSAAMLEIARAKLPGVRLIEADMTSFALGERFDVIICVYDTINHLLDFGQWEAMFDRVSQHLEAGGLFIFDLNTIGRLRQLGDSPPWVHDFDGNVLVMNVEFDGHQMSSWDLRVFAPVDATSFLLHREVIHELGVPLGDVRAALDVRFDVVEGVDSEGDPPLAAAPRRHFRLVEGVPRAPGGSLRRRTRCCTAAAGR